MQPADQVVGVALGDEAKAFPLKILDYHEAVNDDVGGVPVAVTYCPLCDSSAVYDRRHGDRVREFGISGLLYNSNVLLYDRQHDPISESLWSQMRSQAVAGASVQERLKKLPLEVTTWSDWLKRYPHTTALSTNTGHGRMYDRRAYRTYFASPRLMFPVEPSDERLPAKTPVVGVSVGDVHRAYPITAFDDDPVRLEQQLAGKFFAMVYNPASRSIRIEQAAEGVEWMYAFWFAWAAFHPQTEIWQP